MSRSHRRIIPSLLKSAEIHAFIVPAVGGIYLVFLSMRMISEKKNHMVDYLRTMGLLESANIISFARLRDLRSPASHHLRLRRRCRRSRSSVASPLDPHTVVLLLPGGHDDGGDLRLVCASRSLHL